ncbi:MAG: ice-binding family protein, partial [Candidatus Methanoperedens sp.]
MNKQSNVFKNIITVLLTILILGLATGTASAATDITAIGFISGPNQITIVFTPGAGGTTITDAPITAYGTLNLTSGGARNLLNIDSSSFSSNFVYNFSGAPLTNTSETGSINVTVTNSTQIIDDALNTFDTTTNPIVLTDGQPPIFVSAETTSTTTINITFSETIFDNGAPPGNFTITGVASNPNVITLSASGLDSNLTLILDNPITGTDTPSVSYTNNFGPDIADLAGNILFGFASQPVTNTLASSTNGTNLAIIGGSTQTVSVNTNATYTFSLQNNGSLTDNYTISVSNPNTAITGLNITSPVMITNGTTITFTLNVSNASSGTFPVNITATSTNDPSKIGIVNTTTIVGSVQAPVNLGTAGNFAVLAGSAVTCTRSTFGDVGVSPGTAFTPTSCTNGTIHANDSAAIDANSSFLSAYNDLANRTVDAVLTGTLAGVTLSPGVYSFDAAAAPTGLLTLNGPSNGIWIIKIGTSGTGALTGTNFDVVMAGGGQPRNVYWWVKDGATMTDSHIMGTILAGADITFTGTNPTPQATINGSVMAIGAVTLTDTNVTVPSAGSAPNITSWGNNKTNNASTSVTVNASESVNFNASANQTIDTWNWFVDGAAQSSNNFDNLTTSFGSAGTIHTVEVNATNNANGTSNTITWTVTVSPIGVTYSSAQITGPNQITILFVPGTGGTFVADAPITAFGALNLTSGGSRNLTSLVSITGTNPTTAVYTFNGANVNTNATATINVINPTQIIDNPAANTFDPAASPIVLTDGQKPIFVRAVTTSATAINITFSETIVDNGSLPGDFTLTGVATSPFVTVLSASGSNLTLTLDNPMTGSDTPVVGYAPTSGTIDDIAVPPNSLAGFVGQSVTDTLAPGASNGTNLAIISSSTQSVSVNTNATYILTLTNNGSLTDNYTISVSNPNTAITGLNISSSVMLISGATQIFTLNVSDASAGKFPVNITANSTNDPSKVGIVNTTTTITSGLGVPNITSWGNTKTNNASTSVTLNASESVNFNATANQTIDTWNWFKDGASQSNNSNNLTTSFGSAGTHTVKVNATNNTNGTSNTITWTVTVPSSGGAPSITSWGNTKTNSASTSVTVNASESVRFNATANQTVDFNWFKDGSSTGTVFDNLTTSFGSGGTHTVQVNATNSNGTSNTITWTVTVVASGAPSITGSGPASPVTNIAGETRAFNITTDQTLNVTWYINGTSVQTNDSVTSAIYTNMSAAVGSWNVSAVATNVNGSAMNTWTWIVFPVNNQTVTTDSNGNVTAQVNLTSPDGNVTIVIPANTTVTDANGVPITNFTLQEASVSLTGAMATAPSGENFLGVNVDLRPNGAQFVPPIRVRFNYTPAMVVGMDVSSLEIRFFNTSSLAWDSSGIVIIERNTSLNYVIANVSHFSTFALLGTATVTPHPSGGGGSGGGSGGGGVVSGEDFANIAKSESNDEDLVANTPITYKFKTPELGVYEIALTGKENELGITVRAEVLKGTSKQVTSQPPGTVYKNINLIAGTSRMKEALV